MKNLLIITFAMLLFSCKNQAQNLEAAETAIVSETNVENQINKKMDKQNIYQFIVKAINGKEYDFAQLKGKKIMIVNTASKCGYTPQYEDLQVLYDKFKDKNFIIIGFPSNNFGGQEPGTETEIAEFCKANYGVSFPMMSKISVTGKEMAPIYKFLTDKKLNGLEDSKVEWNFQKYLIDEKGNLVKILKSNVKPFDNEIVEWIQN